MTEAELKRPSALLGRLTPLRFMRTIWQRTPQWVTGAVRDTAHLLTPEQLVKLSMRDDVESRLIWREGAAWRNMNLLHGPFKRADFKALPEKNWTLLVQGVNLQVPSVDTLLHRFNFVPYARLDDVMVSLAAPGGGVGPHLDSYDVFLLQGLGVRRWGVQQSPNELMRSKEPVKILQRFKADETRDLKQGDMLYVPPKVAHHGVAVGAAPCTTYSIGFRGPSSLEAQSSFFDFFHEHLSQQASEPYRDNALQATSTPGRVPKVVRQTIAQHLKSFRVSPALIDTFVGCLLTEPKANTVFTPPDDAYSFKQFEARLKQGGARLHAKTRTLYDDERVFWNGAVISGVRPTDAWRAFADSRHLALPKKSSSNDLLGAKWLFERYLDGEIVV